MTSGTIHALDADFFVVEGEWPSPSAAVYHCGRRLYLLGTGARPAQRAAIRAIAASYGRVHELVLLGSHVGSRPDSNDDLLDELPSMRRRHLRPGGPGADRHPSPSVPVEDYAVIGGPGSVAVGSLAWPGWRIGDSGLSVLRLGPPDPGQVVFRATGPRALILSEVGLDVGHPRGHRVPTEVVPPLLQLLEDPIVRVVSPGFGPPLDAVAYRRLLLSLLEARGAGDEFGRQQ